MPQIPPEYVWKKITLSLPTKITPRVRRGYVGWLVAAALAALTLVSYQVIRTPDFTPLTVMRGAEQQGQWVVSADKALTQLRVTPLQPSLLAQTTACNCGSSLPVNSPFRWGC